MKKYFFFALTAAMMSFAGCQEMEQEAPVNPNESGSTFEFVADIAQTKTTLDVANGYKVDWEEGDLVYMVTSDGTWGAAYGDDRDAKTIAEFKYADGKFTSEATIAKGEYTFKGMYAAASQKSYHRGASSTHKLEATQTQNCATPTAHIKANDALVGTFKATVPMIEMAKMDMSHLYTLMQVNVKNATGAAVNVTKFEMTAAGADLAAIFNVTAFDTPAITKKQNESSTITVNLTGGSVENNASLPVYFVMAPLSNYAGDVTFKVTDSEGKTYTKTVTMNGISFEAGKYNTTPYTIKEADVVEPEQPGETTEAWTLVTDASTLAVGDKIVIVASASNHAMGADKGNNRNAASITKSGNTVVINDDVQIITLEAGKVSNTFAFNTGEGYLYAASSSNNYLKTKAQLDNNGSWAITITSTGVATIKSQGTYTRNWIRKNSSSALFACYASGQSDVSIYKLVGGSSEGGGETPAAPVISVTSETTIEVPAAGGNINIEWSVAPSVEDVYLEATEDVDWISPVTRSTVSGNLQYTVEENSGEARTATITLAYTGAESKTVTVKQAAPIKTQTIAEVLSLDKDSSVKTEGIVVAKYERGILISDDTGVILVYNGSSVAPVVGDKVSVSGKKGEYYGWAQIASPITIEVVSSENEVTYPNVTELDGTGMDNLLSATSVSYIQYTGTLTISGTYYNVGVEGATTAIGSIQYPVASLGLSDMHGKKIKVTGYHVGISSNKYVNTMATSVEVVETEEEPETPAPVINILTASPIEVAANGGNGTISYAIGNPTTATITATDNAEWLTLGVPTSTSVSYTVIENTGAERIATITLAYEGAESKTVTVKQAAAEQVGGDEPDQPAEPVEYTLKFGSSYNSKSVQSYTDTWYSTTNGFKCTLVNWNNNQNGWSYVKAGRKNTASVATITTTNVVEAALETVTMTVDAVTTSKINSLKLYVSTDPNFSSKVEYTATAAKGDVVFNITDPIPNAYYKIEVNCASGSSNGLITVSKIVYKN